MGIFYNQKQKELIKIVNTSYPLVEVKAGKILYNYRCHLNSVHYAIKKGHKKIAMVFYTDEYDAILHFVNVTKKGKLIDNTLGIWSQKYKMYLVEYIDKEHFFDIDTIFRNKRAEIFKKLPLYIRMTEDMNI